MEVKGTLGLRSDFHSFTLPPADCDGSSMIADPLLVLSLYWMLILADQLANLASLCCIAPKSCYYLGRRNYLPVARAFRDCIEP